MAAQIGQTISSPYYNSGSVNQSTGAISNQSYAQPTSGTAAAFQTGGWYGGKQWNGSSFGSPGQVTVGNGASSSGSGGSSSNNSSSSNGSANLPSLDSLYAPIFASYDATKNQLTGMQSQDTTDLTNSYNQNKGLIPGYLQQANLTLDQNKTNLGNQLQSAYSQAGRNYLTAANNALNQYGTSTGPIANSPYDAANSLATQELYREQGGIGQQGVQGQQQLNSEGQGITNWGNQQNATLDQQFSSAKDQLNQFFQQQLLAIQNDENATQAQKAAGKTQLLEDVMNQNNAITMQHNAFQQQLQLYNAQMGATGGQNIDMSGFLSQMNALGGNMSQNVNPANQAAQVLTGQQTNAYSGYQGGTQQYNNDFLHQVSPFQTTIPTGQGLTQ